MNPNNYFDHDADIGIIGRGDTLEDSFIDAAQAAFTLMSDVDNISPKNKIEFDFVEDDIELAFVTWLNLLLANARTHDLFLCKTELIRKNSHWYGKAWGEPTSKKLIAGPEIKGATLTMLSVNQTNNHWQAQCVVDI